jgi:hypothetical protein
MQISEVTRMRIKLGLTLANAPLSVPLTRERADKFLCELANVPNYDYSSDGPNAKQGADGGFHLEIPAGVKDAWRRVDNLFRDLLPKHGNPIDEKGSKTDAPGLAWVDCYDPDWVILEDIPPKLRQAWELPSIQSRKMFLICELAYYLRGPAMLAAATIAHEAEVEASTRAREEGTTREQAWAVGSKRWSEVLSTEGEQARKLWAISEADAFAQVLLRAIDASDRMRRCANPDCPAPYFIGLRRSQRYCGDTCALPAQREFKRIWWREHGNNRRGKKNSRCA